MGLLYSLLIGAVAGWLAGKLMKGGGFGLLVNIILGILGGVVAGWLFGKLNIHISTGILGDILKGAIGATIILFVANLLKK
ncbi:GlsB/YeaQ/YmgE family stress response membrane protein [Kordia sp.]|uniref:GlsB/YeaQ/YmgE family stress response membrane protein n=1 Tax=Kordia sp. TaxID=1965332 RepID=UPI003B5C70F9